MRRCEFEYDLPESRIAQTPLEDRDTARLLVLERESGNIEHTRFDKLHEFITRGDLLVLNNTRVMKCRLLGHRDIGGGKVELFLLRKIEDGIYEALGKASRPLRPGSRLVFGQGRLTATVLEKDGRKLRVSLDAKQGGIDEVLDQIAEMPLPPYIKRPKGPDAADEMLYQTVYSRRPGAVAAPTAGLHFTRKYLDNLADLGIEFAEITVHTGLGSFTPIRTEQIEDHEMP
ncbi:MAG: S-adenosylmethionine:tRNA ribosyltransferase-isomerase, partial [Candidatus Coatesbacteria bacterium]|nr:S-adenosylmethionine:tRNA ribosyltransferase-isomerase [Candidatus Coatesbacteria bacterium]